MKLQWVKNTTQGLCTLTAAALLTLNSSALIRGADAELESYPWSDSSATVRVPKSLLPQLSIPGVGVARGVGTAPKIILSQYFIRAFRLTPAEADRVNQAVADGLHSFRTTEGKQLVPTTNDLTFGRRGGARGGRLGAAGGIGPGALAAQQEVLEEHNFELNVDPEEVAAIWKKLQSEIGVALGPERARLFWQTATEVIGGQTFPPSDPNSSGPPPDVTAYYESYRLMGIGVPNSIQLARVTRRVNGSGSSSGPPMAELDPYAPEVMKPILERWRKELVPLGAALNRGLAAANAGTPITTNRLPTVALPPVAPVPVVAPVTYGFPSESMFDASVTWKEADPFVDWPKETIASLPNPSLTWEETVAPELAAVLGLAKQQEAEVNRLFGAFKARVEGLEKAHLERVDDGADANRPSFVLRAFPQEMDALVNEWKSKLAGLVGTKRADLLDRSFQTGYRGQGAAVLLQTGERGSGARAGLGGGGGGGAGAGPRAGLSPLALGPVWLSRGRGETRFDFTVNPAVNGRPSIQLQYRGDNGGGGGGFGGPSPFADRFKHLFTPESLLVLPRQL